MRFHPAYAHPRDRVLASIERIYRYRMTTTSGGNISLREESGDIWITPARLDKGSLRREDIVCVRGNGSVDGPHRPSSEFPFHQAIYGARPDLRGVVHAHSVALVAFSLVRRTPDTRLFHQAHHVCGEAGFAPYELPGSEALGRSIASVFAGGLSAVILENHGVVTAGSSLEEAFHRFETLEFTAKTVIKATRLGEIRYLTNQELELPARRPSEWEEFEHTTVTSAEMELRLQLAAFVRRAYRQRLFISTQGSFSARVDASSFLITPYNFDRGWMEPQDLVLVREGRVEARKRPSRAARSHDAIYRRHAAAGAVINAYPVNATAFSVTGATLDTRTIPESFVVLREVSRVPYGIQFVSPDQTARAITPHQPAALLENDGVLVTGRTILEAFDRLEVLEATAEALINCRSAGTLSPLSDQRLEELKQAFPLGA
jgi:L-fuculose-phosphate aldolase